MYQQPTYRMDIPADPSYDFYRKIEESVRKDKELEKRIAELERIIKEKKDSPKPEN